MNELMTMHAFEAATSTGRDHYARHNKIDDLSLYNHFGAVERVPLEAMVSTADDLVTPVKVKRFHGLMNSKTRQLLDVRPIGKTYALVNHGPVFEAQAKQLAASDLPLDNVEVLDRVYDAGARAHRTIIFHDLSKQTKNRTGKPDIVRCRMDIFNSVDMSWAFQIFSGAYRDLCRNTLVFGGEKAYHQRKIHKGTLSPDAMIAKATMGLEMWRNQSDLMERWSETGLTPRQFADILKETICYKKNAASRVLHDDEDVTVNQKKLNWLLERFGEERNELGETLWAAYNALTHYATHLPLTNTAGRKELKTAKRNDEVRAVIESPAWKYMEGVAA